MKKFGILTLTAVMAFALYAWVYQLQTGLTVTGMNKPVFWGLYIVTFVFFIGVSAGGIAVAALSHLAGIEKFRPISRVAEVVAVISLVLAMGGIIFDLGRPDRILNLLLHPQLSSPLIWDVAVISIYLLLCLAMLFLSLKEKTRGLRVAAVLSIPAFVLVHSITAWIFGLMKAQPGWHTAILAPLFIASALVSGLGLTILALSFARRFLNLAFDPEIIIALGKYFKILLPVLFYFLLCEFLTISYAGVPAHAVVFQEMFTGKFSGIFWFDVVVGVVLPYLIILSPAGKSQGGTILAALLAFAGVFAERLDIVLPSFYHPFLMNDRVVYGYSPTWVEYSLVAGLLALGTMLFVVISKFIPLVEGERK